VASIPSKYETILHREANERDAFGIRTQRFNDSEVLLLETGNTKTELTALDDL
jgi:hypothetical protein